MLNKLLQGRNIMGRSIVFKSLPRVLTLGAFAISSQYAAAQQSGVAGDESAALINEYCSECHNLDDYSGGIDLEGIGAHNIVEYPEIGEKVIKRLRAGMMPPVGEPRPDYEAVQALAASLEQSIDAAAASVPAHLPAPGLHRLN